MTELTSMSMSNLTIVVIVIDCMTARDDCPSRVQEQLGSVAEVESVTVDFATKKATCLMRPGTVTASLFFKLAGS